MSNYNTNKNIFIPVELETGDENNTDCGNIYAETYASAKACFYSILYGIECDNYRDYPLKINSKIAQTINILEEAKNKIVDAICFIDSFYDESETEDVYDISYIYSYIEHIQDKLATLCQSPIEHFPTLNMEVIK